MKISFNKKSYTKKEAGFSIVETLVYIFLVALLTIAVVTVLSRMTKSYKDIRSERAMSLSANTLLNRFSYEVRRATNLSGTFGISSSTLTLTQGTTTTSFSLEASSSRVLITTNGVQDYLTSSDTRVTSLIFYLLQATSTSKGATLQFTISNTSGNIRTENFESSSIIRNLSI